MHLSDKHKLDVMFFLPSLGGGGAEMHAVRLAEGLVAAGIQPTYVVTRASGAYSQFLPPGVEVIVLETGRIDSSAIRLMRAKRELANVVNQLKPDVLCPVMLHSAVCAMSSRKMFEHRPLVVPCIQNSLQVTHLQRRSLWSNLQVRSIKRHLSDSDGMVALSTGVAAEFRKLLGSKGPEISVIHNVGLPLSNQLFKDDRLEDPNQNDRITIIACGRLMPQKDYPTLLSAFSSIDSTVPVFLEILGDGKLRPTLQNLASRLGIADRVQFLGFRSDPLSFMRRADIFVLSSQWEGFGNVIVEAMSVGVPVIATDCPHGPAEIIENDVSGLLVPPGDVSALGEAIRKLIANPSLRDSLSKAGLKRAGDFSTHSIGAKYAIYFNTLTSSTIRQND